MKGGPQARSQWTGQPGRGCAGRSFGQGAGRDDAVDGVGDENLARLPQDPRADRRLEGGDPELSRQPQDSFPGDSGEDPAVRRRGSARCPRSPRRRWPGRSPGCPRSRPGSGDARPGSGRPAPWLDRGPGGSCHLCAPSPPGIMGGRSPIVSGVAPAGTTWTATWTGPPTGLAAIRRRPSGRTARRSASSAGRPGGSGLPKTWSKLS